MKNILKKRNFWFTVLPALIWLTAFSSRHLTLKTICADSPQSCTPDTLYWPDKEVVKNSNHYADWHSNWTQYSAGALAVVAPIALSGARLVTGAIVPGTALAMIGTDILLVTQATFWNGAINELIKIGVNRPRPFVYRDPANEGKVHHSYSSFYSGHTSFAALATFGVVANLIARSAPLWMTLLFGFSGAVLTIVTGTLRVVAGVHFVTDVAFGLLAGIVISYWVQKKRYRET